MITFFFILYFDRASTRAAVPQPVPGTGLFSVEAVFVKAVFADTEKDLLKRVIFFAVIPAPPVRSRSYSHVHNDLLTMQVCGPGNYNLDTVCRRFEVTVEIVERPGELVFVVVGSDKKKVANAASRVRSLGRPKPVVAPVVGGGGEGAAADNDGQDDGRRLWELGHHSDADVARLVGSVLSAAPAAPAACIC